VRITASLATSPSRRSASRLRRNAESRTGRLPISVTPRKPFAEVFQENQRRVWVRLAEIPQHVRNAFIAAEDKRFAEHKGIDEHGLVRAFLGNLAQSRRPQGGSTITQQVVKNLLVGEDVTYERKIREMIVAARLESTLTKDEILELYLNYVYLGRSSWGVEVAARSYLASRKDLTLNEGALLAGLTKGPTYFSPDRQPNRARERLAYVLNRMGEDGMLGTEPHTEGTGTGPPPLPVIVASARPRRDIGFHFVDQVAREARTIAGLDRMTDTSYTVHSTIDQPLQRAVEEALQEGLARYERQQRPGAVHGPEATSGPAILRPLKPTGTTPIGGRSAGRLRQLPACRLKTSTGCRAAAGGPRWKKRRRTLARLAWPYAATTLALQQRAVPREASSPSMMWCSSMWRRREAKRRRGPSCGCALWFRARWWCWRIRRAAFSRWQADSPIRSVSSIAPPSQCASPAPP
jgi:hypothetical protein